MKTIQKQIIRNLLLNEDMSKATLSKALKLSKTAIGKQTNELITQNIVIEDGAFISSGPGRHHGKLKINPDSFCACGININSSQAEICFINGAKELVNKLTYPFNPEKTKKKLQDKIAELFNKFIKDSGISKNKISAMGFSTSGIVDWESGDLLKSGSLRVEERLPLKKKLEEKLNIPVFVEEVVKAHTYYEYHYGAGRGTRNMLYASARSGCAGIIADGRLFYGAGSLAGQTGDFVINPQGSVSNSGKRGTLSSYFSLPAFLKQVEQMPHSEEPPRLSKIKTEKDFQEAYKAGNSAICQIVSESISQAAFFFSNIMTLMPVDMILLDKWLAARPECSLEIIRHKLRRFADLGLEIKVEPSSHCKDQPSLYAALLALTRYFE